MSRRMRTLTIVGSFVAALSIIAGRASADAELAREILNTTGVKGGFVVHLGAKDGRLTAALRPNERYQVHGLDVDAAN